TPRVYSCLTALVMLLLLLPECATAPKQAPKPSPEKKGLSGVTSRISDILREMSEIRRAESSDDETYPDTAASGQSRLEQRLNRQAQVLARAASRQMGVDFEARMYQMFGAPEPLKDETVMLEAIDSKGQVSQVPLVIQTRQLRSLTDANVAMKAMRLVGEDEFITASYKEVPEPVEAETESLFCRVYEEAAAQAIAMEARLIVMLKGGEWTVPEGKKPVANAIAIRGLDFEKGQKKNWNKTYDDTMYLVLESASAPPEVFEYRMTTESSSESKGVGRLESKQVTYIRGKHRGTDPAYRLQGNAAPGTRLGLEGEQQITGANIHSAYSKQPIDSETPLQPNVSLGCQVVAASKRDFEKALVQALDKRGVTQFLYTIVDDAELVEFNRILESRGVTPILADAVSR
ncbi:MAG TPA: hypothetical protein PLD73_18375, partial [Candidatus Hydrogenedentes bacterium]|nr:hypothetical protein [Candidatus Hydrogenedentota bacterium]